jgi:hypothetical protein
MGQSWLCRGKAFSRVPTFSSAGALKLLHAQRGRCDTVVEGRYLRNEFRRCALCSPRAKTRQPRARRREFYERAAALGSSGAITFRRPERAKQVGIVESIVSPFQGCALQFASQPRAALRGYAAPLCPGLSCFGPFGATKTRNVKLTHRALREQKKTGGAVRPAPPVPQGAIATLLVCKLERIRGGNVTGKVFRMSREPGGVQSGESRARDVSGSSVLGCLDSPLALDSPLSSLRSSMW